MAEFLNYWYWLAGGTLLLVLEIVVPGIFLLWFGLGAWLVGLFLLLFPDASLQWQIIALCVCAVGSVLAGVRWQKRILRQQPNQLNQGMDALIGRVATVSENFVNGQGRVLLDGTGYPAICAEQEKTLLAQSTVKIIAVDDSGRLMVSH